MQAGNWLPLTDYASKHRISVSTLRRRIKSGQIDFRLEDGKYWILDTGSTQNLSNSSQAGAQSSSPPSMVSSSLSPSLTSSMAESTAEAETEPVAFHAASAIEAAPLMQNAQAKIEQMKEGSKDHSLPQEEPILSSASRLLNELKRAYMSILQEKEE